MTWPNLRTGAEWDAGPGAAVTVTPLRLVRNANNRIVIAGTGPVTAIFTEVSPGRHVLTTNLALPPSLRIQRIGDNRIRIG